MSRKSWGRQFLKTLAYLLLYGISLYIAIILGMLIWAKVWK
jgi:hypothetical protein